MLVVLTLNSATSLDDSIVHCTPENTSRSDQGWSIYCTLGHPLEVNPLGKNRPLRQTTGLQTSMIRNVAFISTLLFKSVTPGQGLL